MTRLRAALQRWTQSSWICVVTGQHRFAQIADLRATRVCQRCGVEGR